MVESGRICKRCEVWKSAENFYRRQDKPDYLVAICRECVSRAGKRPPPPVRRCANCNSEYQPQRQGRRSCSQACGNTARRLARAIPKPPRSILVVDDQKRCNKCLQWRPLNEFGLRKDRRNTPLSECRSCSADRSLRYSRSDLGRHTRYAYKYGVSIEWYETKLAEIGGVCPICGQPPNPMDPVHPRLVIDHCHESGVARGLLCQRCNLLIGLCGEDEQVLAGAINYLRQVTQAQQPSLSGDGHASRD